MLVMMADKSSLFLFFLNSDTGQRCPVDNETLSKDQLFPDNFAKREILSLTVRCPNSGCGDKMELRHLEVRTQRLKSTFFCVNIRRM